MDWSSQVVVNASPLIVLCKSGQVELLPKLFSRIVVPQAVYQEITSTKADSAAIQLPTLSWSNVVTPAINPVILAWDLGAGESAVLSFALANPKFRAMVDDAAARRCARSLDIPTIGTGAHWFWPNGGGSFLLSLNLYKLYEMQDFGFRKM